MKNRKQAAIAFVFGHFSYSTVKNRVYARSILPERRHLEQTYIWQGVPFTIAFTRFTFGFHVLFDRLWEWETLIPKVTPFPQTSHLAILLHLLILTLHADRRKIDFCGSLQTNISILSNFPKKSNPFPWILLNIFFYDQNTFRKIQLFAKTDCKIKCRLIFEKQLKKKSAHFRHSVLRKSCKFYVKRQNRLEFFRKTMYNKKNTL